MPESSIVITAQDKYSSAVKAMSNVTKSFSKDQEEMERKLIALNKNQSELQKELKTSRERLKELEKQFDETGDAIAKAQLQSERAKFDQIQRNLRLVTKGANEAEKQMQKTGEAFSKTGNKAGISSGGFQSMISAFAANGIGQMVGQLAQAGASSFVNSAFGADVGTVFSSALSSAVSGGAIGFTLGGPLGAAAGAVLGGLAGIGNGALQNYEKRDDYFKSYYNGIIDDQEQAMTEAIQSGSSIAAGRETDRFSFSTLFKSEKAADTYLSDLVDMANHTPFLYDDLTAMSKTLATYGYGANDILPVLTKIGDAGAALGMSTSDMTMVATALGRMKSSDKATLEYLNILNDRGIGAVGMLAEAKGLSVGDTYSAISKGTIKGGEAVEIILAALQEAYAGMMETQSATFAGKTSTLSGLTQEMENAYGVGYNETRDAGLTAEIASLDGGLGHAMTELNEISGSLAGYRENLQEQYTREALGAVLTGRSTTLYDEETAAELEKMGRQYQALAGVYERTQDPELGLKMENLRGQAEALAKNAYDSSEWAKKELSAEEENTKAIRDMTAAFDGWSALYHAEQVSTTGRAAAFRPMVDVPASNYLGGSVNGTHAAGLTRVPFDNYLALLHEGERVLTAQEARQADQGGGAGSVVVNVSGNQFTVRSEDDAEAIAQLLAEKIVLARQSGTL